MFSVTQHSRDAALLKLFCEFLDCGKYYPSSTRNEGNYTVTKFSDIEQKIIPFFLKYPIHGVKGLDFSDFSKIGYLVKEKEHLTEQGLAKIGVGKTIKFRGPPKASGTKQLLKNDLWLK